MVLVIFFFFQAEDGIRDVAVTGVQTCALPISPVARARVGAGASRGGRREPPVPRRGRGRSPQDPVEDGDLDALVLLRRPDLRGTGARGRGEIGRAHV